MAAWRLRVATTQLTASWKAENSSAAAQRPGSRGVAIAAADFYRAGDAQLRRPSNLGVLRDVPLEVYHR